MKFIYDIAAKKHGEGEGAISFYKKLAVAVYVLLAAAVEVLFYFICVWTNRNMTIAYIVMGVIAVYFIYEIVCVLRASANTLHSSVNISQIDTHGGKLETYDLHGEKIFKITLPNDASVKVTYFGGRYTCTVFNDEWDEVAKFVADDLQSFYEAYERAASYAESLVKLPEGEYDDTPRTQSEEPADEEIYIDTDEEYESDDDDEDSDDEDSDGDEDE